MRKAYRKRQVLWLGLLASLTGTAAVHEAMAASAPPVFSSTAQTAWVGIGIGAFAPVPARQRLSGRTPPIATCPTELPGNNQPSAFRTSVTPI